MTRILVTAFEPFGGESQNATLATLAALDRKVGALVGVEVHTAVLPVNFADIPQALQGALQRARPDAVIALGEAGRRSVITPERWGHNLIDARIPDNTGSQPRGVPIEHDGPQRCPLSLDPDLLVASIQECGLAAQVSESAGSFACNQVAYLLARQSLPASFVHIPALRSRGSAVVGAETDEPTGQTAAGTDHAGLRVPGSADDLAAALVAVLAATHTAVARGHDR